MDLAMRDVVAYGSVGGMNARCRDSAALERLRVGHARPWHDDVI